MEFMTRTKKNSEFRRWQIEKIVLLAFSFCWPLVLHPLFFSTFCIFSILISFILWNISYLTIWAFKTPVLDFLEPILKTNIKDIFNFLKLIDALSEKFYHQNIQKKIELKKKSYLFWQRQFYSWWLCVYHNNGSKQFIEIIKCHSVSIYSMFTEVDLNEPTINHNLTCGK